MQDGRADVVTACVWYMYKPTRAYARVHRYYAYCAESASVMRETLIGCRAIGLVVDGVFNKMTQHTSAKRKLSLQLSSVVVVASPELPAQRQMSSYQRMSLVVSVCVLILCHSYLNLT